VDFAAVYGFDVKTCRVRRARTKGKVERMVDYVKDNFLLAREFADLEDLNSQARAWLDNTAHTRVACHHRSSSDRPAQQRAPAVKALDSIRPYTFIERHPRKVAKESMISFRSSRYSVPPVYVGREVTVEVSWRPGQPSSSAAVMRSWPSIAPRKSRGIADSQRASGRAVEAGVAASARAVAQLENDLRSRRRRHALDRYQQLVDLPVLASQKRSLGNGGDAMSILPKAPQSSTKAKAAEAWSIWVEGCSSNTWINGPAGRRGRLELHTLFGLSARWRTGRTRRRSVELHCSLAASRITRAAGGLRLQPLAVNRPPASSRNWPPDASPPRPQRRLLTAGCGQNIPGDRLDVCAFVNWSARLLHHRHRTGPPVDQSHPRTPLHREMKISCAPAS